MKVSVDVEITPEELRRLMGLPDFSPAQDLVVERVTRQIEKSLDGQLLTGIMKTVVSGGMQGLEAYQKLVSGVLSATVSPKAEAGKTKQAKTADADSTQDKTAKERT